MVNSLYESYSERDNTLQLDTSALQILCLSNSITYHPPLKGDLPGADSLWRGNWGMCASRPERDDVHSLESMFREYNLNTKSLSRIWKWGNNFAINLD